MIGGKFITNRKIKWNEPIMSKDTNLIVDNQVSKLISNWFDKDKVDPNEEKRDEENLKFLNKISQKK